MSAAPSSLRRLLLAAVAGLAPAAAAAGAWTLPRGEGFLSAGASYYALDGGGFEEATASSYAEYGLLDAFTIGGALETSQPLGEPLSLGGDTTLTALGRVRLHVGPAGDPFSLQASVGAPLDELTAELSDAPRPEQVENDPEVDVRALYGRGFGSRFGPGWLNAETGLRLHLDDDADEIRVDLTAGLRPAPRWLAMVQSFATIGLRNNEPFGDDYDVLKIAPSVGYEVTPSVTLVLGAEREVAGRNIVFGTRARLSVWTRF